MSAKDRLSVVPASEAVRAAFVALDTLQTSPPAYQVAAISVLFKEFSEGLGISPSELLDKARRWTADNDTFFQREVKALRDYVQQEVRK